METIVCTEAICQNFKPRISGAAHPKFVTSRWVRVRVRDKILTSCTMSPAHLPLATAKDISSVPSLFRRLLRWSSLMTTGRQTRLPFCSLAIILRIRDRHIILFNFPFILFFNSFILPYYSFPLFSFSPYYSFHLSLSHM